MELNSSVVIVSSVAGSLGSDNEKGMLLVMMICLYNALITTEAGKPSLDIIDSACSFTSGSTRASGKEKAHKAMSELLEKILSKDNMNAAYKRVCANKGAGGVDEVTVEGLGDYIKESLFRKT